MNFSNGLKDLSSPNQQIYMSLNFITNSPEIQISKEKTIDSPQRMTDTGSKLYQMALAYLDSDSYQNEETFIPTRFSLINHDSEDPSSKEPWEYESIQSSEEPPQRERLSAERDIAAHTAFLIKRDRIKRPSKNTKKWLVTAREFMRERLLSSAYDPNQSLHKLFIENYPYSPLNRKQLYNIRAVLTRKLRIDTKSGLTYHRILKPLVPMTGGFETKYTREI